MYKNTKKCKSHGGQNALIGGQNAFFSVFYAPYPLLKGIFSGNGTLFPLSDGKMDEKAVRATEWSTWRKMKGKSHATDFPEQRCGVGKAALTKSKKDDFTE